MRKAVAVPYIIAILLGVAVIGLLGVWFVMSGGKLSTQSTRTLCDNEFFKWCITNPSEDFDTFDNTKTDCIGQGSFQKCDQILGTQSCKKKDEACNLNTDCCSGRCIDSGPSAVCG